MFKISVIVPVYDVEKYLPKCLDSLINQTEKVKIIIVNDSSKDDSQRIIDMYKSQYPDQIDFYVKPNGGIADTRNFGLSKVETEYFGFIDSDDYVEPDMYQKLLESIEENESDIATCNFYWAYEKNEKIGFDGPYEPGKSMLINQMATLWSKLYRTSAIKKTQLAFPTGYQYEDAYFLYCLAPNLRKISHVDQPFVHYVQREGSITHNNNVKVKDMVSIFGFILDYYKKENIYDDYQEELEYLFTKFFLGNSFLRAIKIEDKKVRSETLNLSYSFLKENFPEYYKNSYLKKNRSLKNIYFSMVRDWNFNFFVFLFRLLKK